MRVNIFDFWLQEVLEVATVQKALGKYAHINFKPPESVAAAARRGLELRKQAPKSKKGGLDQKQASTHGIGSGVSRASSLANRQNKSPDTIQRMVAFFARHSAYKHKHKTDPKAKLDKVGCFGVVMPVKPGLTRLSVKWKLQIKRVKHEDPSTKA